MHTLENSYALVIGISNYQHVNKLVPAVSRDAMEIYEVLVDPLICAYPSRNVRRMLDAQATRSRVLQVLSEMCKTTNDDSIVLIYWSGHGGRIQDGPYAGEYLLPVDTVYTSDDSLATTAISGQEFATLLRGIPARKLVVILDCCHAGGIDQPKGLSTSTLKTGLSETFYETLKSGRGRVILASSRSDELSWVLPGAQNSLFTEYILEGLRGGAIGVGGVIRIFDLFHYVQPKVTHARPSQHPIFKAEIEENFPIALYLGGKVASPRIDAQTEDKFLYDVFISYHQKEPDKSWVRGTLLRKLESKGISVCIDFRDFRLGAPIINEMERAVIESRYTLGILTPLYLESNFAQLENILAEQLGLEKSQRRWIAVMRQDCTPPLRIRARLWLDMTDDNSLEENIARLIYELRRPPV